MRKGAARSGVPQLTPERHERMKVLKNIAFGLGHGLVLTALLFATVGGSLFLVVLLAPTLKAMPLYPVAQLLVATFVMVALIAAVAVKVIYPYTQWLEPRLRKFM